MCVGVLITRKVLMHTKKGNYATALKEWTPLAKQGNAVAQYNLDVIYDNGLGVHRIIGLR